MSSFFYALKIRLTFPVSRLLYMNDKGMKGKVQYEETGKTQKETERAIFRLGARAAHGPDTVVGSPVLFGCGYFPALRTLPEGKGGGAVVKRHAEKVTLFPARHPAELMDADTPDVLAELKLIFQNDSFYR